MDSLHRYRKRLHLRHLLIGLLVWWSAMTLCYFALWLWADSQGIQGRSTGIALVQKYAKQLSVPLLDRDSSNIRFVLNEALAHEHVMLASVLDHQHAAVALVGSEAVFNPATRTREPQTEVLFWEVAFPKSDSWLGLQAPIQFADVPIGQLRLYVSGSDAGGARVVFAITAVASLLIIVLSYAASQFRIVRVAGLPSGEGADSAGEAAKPPREPQARCPLCGTSHPLSNRLFSPNGNWRTLQTKGHGRNDLRLLRDIDPGRTSGHPEAAQLRKKVILRCAEIIQKLTA